MLIQFANDPIWRSHLPVIENLRRSGRTSAITRSVSTTTALAMVRYPVLLQKFESRQGYQISKRLFDSAPAAFNSM
jgi:hypothetical protein